MENKLQRASLPIRRAPLRVAAKHSCVAAMIVFSIRHSSAGGGV